LIFTPIKIAGSFIIDPELSKDERGFFARSFCQDEFRQFGLESRIVQCSISYNRKKGTLRGLHFQDTPHEEEKIVSCTKGSIYDVILDLRKDSRTYCQWVSIELTEKNFRMVYIPRGCAHGFQTLVDNSIVYYQMTEFFHPECARAVRWDDPKFKIVWMLNEKIISEKDQNNPDYCL
jgi:dTDP-4-dehydrorhamnose 3,5-epimerase